MTAAAGIALAIEPIILALPAQLSTIPLGLVYMVFTTSRTDAYSGLRCSDD
jgi:hypothetical protein